MQSPDYLKRRAPNTRSDRYRKKPWRERFKDFGQQFIDAFLRIDAMGLAKQVAYSVVFALVPTMFVLVAIGTIFENVTNVPVTEELRAFVIDNVPAEAQQILLNAIDQAITNTSTATASIGGLLALLLALWAGMGAVNTLVEAINRAYGVRNTRSWPQKRLFSLLMTLALTGMIVLTVAAAFFGDQSIARLTNAFGQSGFLIFSAEAIRVGLIVLTTFLVLLVLYQFSPSVDQRLRWSIPGALLITIAWFVLLLVSGSIVRRINFDTVFGAAGGFILLLYVLNLAALLLIIGGVVNGVLGERYDKKRQADLLANPRKRRYVASGQEVLPEPFKLPFSIPSISRFTR